MEHQTVQRIANGKTEIMEKYIEASVHYFKMLSQNLSWGNEGSMQIFSQDS
jgi:hypothetical protein